MPGLFSFIGGGQTNVAGGMDAAVFAGSSNESCGDSSGVLAGDGNVIQDSLNGVQFGFESTVLGGNSNQVLQSDSWDGAGEDNSFTGTGVNISVVGGQGNVVKSTTDGIESTSILGGASNTIGAPYSTIFGGQANTLYDFYWVSLGGGQSNFAGGTFSSLVGGHSNVLDIGSFYSFMGGGSGLYMDSQMSSIAGGLSNKIPFAYGETSSVVIGGQENAAGESNDFVGGGEQNTITTRSPATGAASNAAIVGGYASSTNGAQTRAGQYAAIGGGLRNTSNGLASSIPGGEKNRASGADSLAMGTRATSSFDGSFLWSDDASPSADLHSTLPNQFEARASGGFLLYSAADKSAGVSLGAGAGSWSSLSDRLSKRDVVDVDAQRVATFVSKLNVPSWGFTADENQARHIGPMAEDFHLAFGLGVSNHQIGVVDEAGVSLEAIKGLALELDAKEQTLEHLRVQVAALKSAIAALKRSRP
jgi:trimeric autotransporter adhesin